MTTPSPRGPKQVLSTSRASLPGDSLASIQKIMSGTDFSALVTPVYLKRFQDIQKMVNGTDFAALVTPKYLKQFQDIQRTINGTDFAALVTPKYLKQFQDIQRTINRTDFASLVTPKYLKQFQDIQRTINRTDFASLVTPKYLSQIQTVQFGFARSFSSLLADAPALLDTSTSMTGLISRASRSTGVEAGQFESAVRLAEDLRSDIGPDTFDVFSQHGSAQQWLTDAGWRLTDWWEDMSPSRQRAVEALLCGVLWLFVLCLVMGIKIEYPVLDRILDDAGISANDVAVAAVGVLLVFRWVHGTSPINKKVKRKELRIRRI